MRGDRLAELLALLRVGEGRLVGADRDADRLPGDLAARQAQHVGDVAERADAGQPLRLGHAHVGHRDVGVLHAAERDLALDLRRREARGVGVDEEALDLAVGLVLGEDHDDVGEGRVADPALRAVQDPAVALAAGGGAQAAGGVGAGERLGEAEGAEHLAGRHASAATPRAARASRRRRSAPIARPLCTPTKVEADASTRPISSAIQPRYTALFSNWRTSGMNAPRQAELGEARDDLLRELGALPVVVRRSAGPRPRSTPGRGAALSRSSRREEVLEVVEVADEIRDVGSPVSSSVDSSVVVIVIALLVDCAARGGGARSSVRITSRSVADAPLGAATIQHGPRRCARPRRAASAATARSLVPSALSVRLGTHADAARAFRDGAPPVHRRRAHRHGRRSRRRSASTAPRCSAGSATATRCSPRCSGRLAVPTLDAADAAVAAAGADRVEAVLTRFVADLIGAAYFRDWITREPSRALRILTTAREPGAPPLRRRHRDAARGGDRGRPDGHPAARARPRDRARAGRRVVHLRRPDRRREPRRRPRRRGPRPGARPDPEEPR